MVMFIVGFVLGFCICLLCGGFLAVYLEDRSPY